MSSSKTRHSPRVRRATHHDRVVRALVAAVSLITVVTFAIPWTNEYFDLQRDAAEMIDLETKLAQTRERQDLLERVEEQLTSDLSHFVDVNISPTNIETVRERLIQIVRSAEARIRRLEISPGDSRPWAIESDDARLEAKPIYAEDSQFALHMHTIELQADGPLKGVEKILTEVANNGWMMTTKNLSIAPTGARESPMKLEIRFVIYGLKPIAVDPDSGDSQVPNEFARLPVGGVVR
ncbi:hypothetical protein Poly51_24780 [Rubripirellula tenax]|uniref:Uncharacterized protein n=1 Tax=Rubripirellula tenax TaxID=2528015 RepID=A0A5C6F6E9_9BACT|nr:hypothetical protein [Rubripirellula tenax]TWU56562.1 hypothetical protein Poly51_24780 [Rubripirellula tenax]